MTTEFGLCHIKKDIFINILVFYVRHCVFFGRRLGCIFQIQLHHTRVQYVCVNQLKIRNRFYKTSRQIGINVMA